MEDATGLRRMVAGLVSHRREIGLTLVVLLLIGNIVALQGTGATIATGNNKKDSGDIAGLGPGGTEAIEASASAAAEEARKAAVAKASAAAKKSGGSVGVPVPKAGTIPPGINYAKQEITVVMYWKEDSQSSTYLPPGVSGETVDDGKAFDAMVKFINKHAKGDANYMGEKIGMGNWKIVPKVVAMNNADQINTGTTRIVSEIKPFTAVTARGSLSTSVCPALAGAGIHNYATLHPYVNNIQTIYKGYCVPSGLSWDQQVEATVNYMKWHKTTKFTAVGRPNQTDNCAAGCDRVYGFLYSDYPGLKDQAPKVAAQLGIPADRIVSLPVGLSDASRGPSQDALTKFKDAGVNTVIMPDGGSPLAFTVGAASPNNWKPDYYVWPCSGQDTTGYTRLLPPTQWDNASGLTCYDDTFDPELTIDTDDRNGEWYKAFKDSYPNDEAPSSAHLVYAALQPLVTGVSRLGTRDFTLENFRAALKEFQPYRYNGNSGKTGAGDNLLLVLGNGADNSLWGDLARVDFDAAKGQNPYTYLDNFRYKSSQSFP